MNDTVFDIDESVLAFARPDESVVTPGTEVDGEYLITGYTWGYSMEFTGTYTFPANKDKYDVHLPPRTTLVAIPSETLNPLVSEYYWTGTSWGIRPTSLLRTIPVNVSAPEPSDAA